MNSPHLESLFTLGAEAESSINSSTRFGDPFMTPSWAAAPKDLTSLFDLCRLVWFRSPEMRAASWRTISYHLNDIEFGGKKTGDRKEQREFREYLLQELGVFVHLQEVGLNYQCYGNGFSRVHLPFNRFLLIPLENGTIHERAVEQAGNPTYDAGTVKYEIDNPVPKPPGGKRWKPRIQVDFVDRRARDMNRIKLRSIDPSLVFLQFRDRSGTYRVAEKFTPELIASVKAGELWSVNDTPLKILQAIAAEQDFLYNEDEVYHLKAPTIAGVTNGGWGIPETLANYQNIHSLAVLRKVDESVGLDYMIPLRVMYPDIGTGGAVNGVASPMDMGMITGAFRNMMQHRRKDPFATMYLPFKMGYEEISGNGRQLTTKDQQQWAIQALLNGAGFPAEVYTGTMRLDTMPIHLKLFENHWQWLKFGLNRRVKQIAETVREHMGLEPIETRLQEPSVAYDVERRNLYIQMAAGGEFSRRRAMDQLGVDDVLDEARTRAVEDQEIQMVQQQVASEYAAQMGQGAMLGNAGVQGAPSGQQYTPNQMAERALEEAKRMLQIQFDGDRQKALAQLRAADEPLYHLVKGKMEELRASARSEGGKQVAAMAAA